MGDQQLPQQQQQQHQNEGVVIPREDAAYRSDLRNLRSEHQRLLNHIKDLRSSKDAMRMQSCGWRGKAEAAVKALEAERRAGAILMKTRESLRAAADSDRKTIARLQAQLCKGAPSSRLLERARCLKRTTERLQHQLETQNETLSARTTELESAKREARELASTLEVSATASDGIVELGKARTANHDLALELARVVGVSETLASDKEELEQRLGRTTEEMRSCLDEIEDVRGCLERAVEEVKECREETSKAQASTREARDLLDTARSKEEKLLQELEISKRREATLKEELATLSTAAERGEAMAKRVEALQAEIEECKAALFDERKQKDRMSADQEASNESLRRVRQSLAAMREVEQEKERLEGLLEEERASVIALREEKDAVKEQLKVALAERGDLVRGLRQAKTYNDQLAKDKYIAEEREREACARFAVVRDGKHALQRALLEQLAAVRGSLREERERRLEAEAALQTFTANAAEGATATSTSIRNRVLNAVLDDTFTSDEDSITLEEGDDSLTSPLLRKPRDTLVQDYLGREGAEQFLSDWDEERSSTSESESCRFSHNGVTSRQSQWELARVHVERQGIMVASSSCVSSLVPETTRQVAAAVLKGAHAREEGVAVGSQQASLSPQDRKARQDHRNSDSDDASAPTPKTQEQDLLGVRQVCGRAACVKDDIALNDFSVSSSVETSTGLDLDKGGAGRSESIAKGGRPSPSRAEGGRWRAGGAGRGTFIAKVSSSEGIIHDDGSGLNNIGKTDGGDCDSGGCGASSWAGGRSGVSKKRREALPRGDMGRRPSLVDLADQSIEDI